MQCIVDGCSGGHFYPRPPRGGRRVQRASSAHKHNFYPRPPRGGRPDHSSGHRHNDFISIHALREEGDRCNLSVVYSSTIFLSTPSARRATGYNAYSGIAGFLFLSTPSARRATARGDGKPDPRNNFYPRPPRGGRLRHHQPRRLCAPISIHALREEGDCTAEQLALKAMQFLSTPSARRATCFLIFFK